MDQCAEVLAVDAANRKALYRRGELLGRRCCSCDVLRRCCASGRGWAGCPCAACIFNTTQAEQLSHAAEFCLRMPAHQSHAAHCCPAAGQALCALGRYDAAVDDLRQAVRLSPESEKVGWQLRLWLCWVWIVVLMAG